MLVFKTKDKLKSYLAPFLSENSTIGFVPTMGALHNGHLSLVEKSKRENTITIASIFVNPTQFDNPDDLLKYPKTVDKDFQLLEQVSCDAVYIPEPQDIYDNKVQSVDYDFDGLEHEMEGAFRKGHFNGVGTVVKKLFEIVSPTNAYFGEKDFQQLQIIKKLVEKEQLSIRVVGCPIYREANGLAMSSRNTRLTSEQREEAALIYQTLKDCQQKYPQGTVIELQKHVEKLFASHPFLDLEYFSIADETSLKNIQQKSDTDSPRAFIAVYAGEIRLIDNLPLYS